MRGVLPGPIGVSFDSRWIRAAQLRRLGAGWEAVALLRLERRGEGLGRVLGAADGAILGGALRRQGFVGGRVVLAGASPAVPLMGLDLPPRSSGAPLAQIAAMEVARAHRLAEGTFALATWDLPEGQGRAGRGEQTSVMAAFCPHAVGETLCASLDGTGLGVVGQDPEARAAARALGPLMAGAGSVALVRSGWDELEVCLVGAGRTLVFHRSIPEQGLSALYRAIGQRTGLRREVVDVVLEGPGEAAREERRSGEMTRREVARCVGEHVHSSAAEVQRSVSYAAGRLGLGEVRGVLLDGEGASLPGLGEAIGGRLAASWRVAVAGSLVRIGPGLARLASCPALAGALGAATWGLAEGREAA